jgi:ribonuclease Z
MFAITGYSTALFSTWYFIEELGILFDCGDGCIAGLLQKSRKVKHIFISHADRDHLTGLLQFAQLNNRPGLPLLYYPSDCGSFPALNAFSGSFDPHIQKGIWQGIKDKEEIRIGKDIIVTAFRNNHVAAAPGYHKSLSYLIERTKRKLKDEYSGLPGHEIAILRKQKGDDELTFEVREKLIGYSGDAPPENEAYWNNTNILIHEGTFLTKEDMAGETPRGNIHSMLEMVLEMVAKINIKHLVLGHFSSRYNDEIIIQAILVTAKKLSLSCTIYAVLPGKIYRNVFENKIYDGSSSS